MKSFKPLVYYYSKRGTDEWDTLYDKCLGHSIASAKYFGYNCEVLSGYLDKPLMVARFKAYLEYLERVNLDPHLPVWFLDPDIIVCQPLPYPSTDGMFIVRPEFTKVKQKPQDMVMAGAMCLKPRGRFILEFAIKKMEEMDPELQEWGGDQVVLSQMFKGCDSTMAELHHNGHTNTYSLVPEEFVMDYTCMEPTLPLSHFKGYRKPGMWGDWKHHGDPAAKRRTTENVLD